MATLADRVRELGLDHQRSIEYDYAVPNEWATDVIEKTGLWPRGIIWLYDTNGLLGPKCGLLGRPFPLTMYGYWVMRLLTLAEGRK